MNAQSPSIPVTLAEALAAREFVRGIALDMLSHDVPCETADLVERLLEDRLANLRKVLRGGRGGFAKLDLTRLDILVSEAAGEARP